MFTERIFFNVYIGIIIIIKIKISQFLVLIYVFIIFVTVTSCKMIISCIIHTPANIEQKHDYINTKLKCIK